MASERFSIYSLKRQLLDSSSLMKQIMLIVVSLFVKCKGGGT